MNYAAVVVTFEFDIYFGLEWMIDVLEINDIHSINPFFIGVNQYYLNRNTFTIIHVFAQSEPVVVSHGNIFNFCQDFPPISVPKCIVENVENTNSM